MKIVSCQKCDIVTIMKNQGRSIRLLVEAATNIVSAVDPKNAKKFD